jgi:hypothetical protein
MTFNDIKVIKNPGTAYTFEASDRTTSSVTVSMKPGEPVKIHSTNEFVVPLETGDPEISTDQFVGIVRKESTESSTVDGKVEVITLVPMSTVLRGKATTSTNINTVAKILALKNDWVCFDLTASSGTNGIFTIDENEGDDPNNHGLMILDGDPVGYTLDVIVHANATIAAPLVGQTMD